MHLGLRSPAGSMTAKLRPIPLLLLIANTIIIVLLVITLNLVIISNVSTIVLYTSHISITTSEYISTKIAPSEIH